MWGAGTWERRSRYIRWANSFMPLTEGTISWCSKGVAKPRFFTLSEDGKYLYCANEESHSVTLYTIDQRSGILDYVDTVMHASAPACILFRSI